MRPVRNKSEGAHQEMVVRRGKDGPLQSLSFTCFPICSGSCVCVLVLSLPSSSLLGLIIIIIRFTIPFIHSCTPEEGACRGTLCKHWAVHCKSSCPAENHSQELQRNFRDKNHLIVSSYIDWTDDEGACLLIVTHTTPSFLPHPGHCKCLPFAPHPLLALPREPACLSSVL